MSVKNPAQFKHTVLSRIDFGIMSQFLANEQFRIIDNMHDHCRFGNYS